MDLRLKQVTKTYKGEEEFVNLKYFKVGKCDGELYGKTEMTKRFWKYNTHKNHYCMQDPDHKAHLKGTRDSSLI
jgi:hypothetical protein